MNAGQNNTAAGDGDLLPDPFNPRDPRNPGAPLMPRAGWDCPPWNRWTYQHMSEMVPTAPIWRGPGPVRPLPESLQPLGDLVVKFDDGALTVDDYLEQNFTDGFLVLHRGRIVFERYMNNFAPHKSHILKSATKSFTGTLIGILVNNGLLDVRSPVTDYLPELAATAYRGATLQHLLDMASGVSYEETFDEGSDMLKAMNASTYHQEVPGWPRTNWELVLSLVELERPHGTSFEYRTIETTVLGFILERVSGKSMADLISQEIWAPMGAEQDAYITVDRAGKGAAGGGLGATLRDLGRFAQLLVEGGARDGRQVIPRSWIDETRAGRGWRFHDPHSGAEGYHNQWWIQDDSRGVIVAHGFGGQIVYVDPDAEFVAVKLSYWPDLENEERYRELGTVVMPAIRAALSPDAPICYA